MAFNLWLLCLVISSTKSRLTYIFLSIFFLSNFSFYGVESRVPFADFLLFHFSFSYLFFIQFQFWFTVGIFLYCLIHTNENKSITIKTKINRIKNKTRETISSITKLKKKNRFSVICLVNVRKIDNKLSAPKAKRKIKWFIIWFVFICVKKKKWKE